MQGRRGFKEVIKQGDHVMDLGERQKDAEQITESATQARQGHRGRPVLVVLVSALALRL